MWIKELARGLRDTESHFLEGSDQRKDTTEIEMYSTSMNTAIDVLSAAL
jgi:hypothetical protein